MRQFFQSSVEILWNAPFIVNCIDVIYSGEVNVKYHFVLLIHVNPRNALPRLYWPLKYFSYV